MNKCDLSWSELGRVSSNWDEMNWTGLNWFELNWTELHRMELDWIGLDWIRLNSIEMGWLELDLIELYTIFLLLIRWSIVFSGRFCRQFTRRRNTRLSAQETQARYILHSEFSVLILRLFFISRYHLYQESPEFTS